MNFRPHLFLRILIYKDCPFLPHVKPDPLLSISMPSLYSNLSYIRTSPMRSVWPSMSPLDFHIVQYLWHHLPEHGISSPVSLHHSLSIFVNAQQMSCAPKRLSSKVGPLIGTSIDLSYLTSNVVHWRLIRLLLAKKLLASL